MPAPAPLRLILRAAIVLPAVEPALSAIVYGRPDVQVTSRLPLEFTAAMRFPRVPKSMSAATTVQLETTATRAWNVPPVTGVPLPAEQGEPPLGTLPLNCSV